jgi:histidinol-phosphatase (PHP family)
MGFRANYHTHTYRCQHATSDAPAYARVAADGGCEILGFSDHTPLPDGRWNDTRMRMDELPAYEQAVAEARKACPGLKILLGMECEYAPEFGAFYREELLGKRRYDYLIGACHYTPNGNRWLNSFEDLNTTEALRAYCDYTVLSMATGLFAFIAHPDMIGCSNAEWTADTAACARDICAASVALKIPLELNANGLRKATIMTADGERPVYPWIPFWQVAAEMGVKIVMNSDAHRPDETMSGYETLAKIRDALGLVEANLDHLVK